MQKGRRGIEICGVDGWAFNSSTFFSSFYVLFDLHTLLVGMINSVDVCQSNGNLLAAGGWDQNIKIFDKREAKIVQIFEIPCESTMFYKFNSIIFTLNSGFSRWDKLCTMESERRYDR